MNSRRGLQILGRRRGLTASLLGAVGGAGVIGGMWLPLANLGGLGPVGFFDHNRARAYACIAAAVVVALFSLARCFRIALLAAGGLCGLLAATGLDLWLVLRDATNLEGTEIAQMTHRMIAHSTLGSGAYLVPVCVAACMLASFVGTAPETVPATTSES